VNSCHKTGLNSVAFSLATGVLRFLQASSVALGEVEGECDDRARNHSDQG